MYFSKCSQKYHECDVQKQVFSGNFEGLGAEERLASDPFFPYFGAAFLRTNGRQQA